MKKIALFLALLLSPISALGQTANTYYTFPTVAAVKALTTRPSVVEIVDANPGVFNWAAVACSAADDIFQITPTSGPTGCYTRMATPYSAGKGSATSLLTSNGTVPSWSSTLPAVTAGAGLVTATGTTTARSLANRFATQYNALDNGMVGDASTDNASALGALFTLCEAQTYGCEIIVPHGTYVFNTKVTTSVSKPVKIIGAGRGEAVLQWTNSDGGIAFTFTEVYSPPAFSGLSFRTTYTTGAGGGTALKITGPTSMGVAIQSLLQGATVTDVDMGSAAGYWTGGLHFVDTWDPSVLRFSYRGAAADGSNTSGTFLSSFGIKYERTQSLFISNYMAYHVQDAVLQAGTTFGEGLVVQGCQIVGVNTGFNLTSWVTGTVAITGISNCHINAYEYGIRTLGVVQAAYNGIQIYKTHLSTLSFTGIRAELADNSTFNVRIHAVGTGVTSGGMQGIVLVNTKYANLHDNSFDHWEAAGTAITIGTSSSYNTITNNVGGAQGSAINTVLLNSDAGSNNFISGNLSASGTAVINNSTVAQRIIAPIQAGILLVSKAIDFSTGNTDFAVSIELPPGYSRYIINSTRLSGASANLTAATCGIFTSTGGGGTVVVASATAVTISTAAESTNGNAQLLSVIAVQTTTFNNTTLYFRVQSSAAGTATLTFNIAPVS